MRIPVSADPTRSNLGPANLTRSVALNRWICFALFLSISLFIVVVCYIAFRCLLRYKLICQRPRMAPGDAEMLPGDPGYRLQ
jgi:hypothetical protein